MPVGARPWTVSVRVDRLGVGPTALPYLDSSTAHRGYPSYKERSRRGRAAPGLDQPSINYVTLPPLRLSVCLLRLIDGWTVRIQLPVLYSLSTYTALPILCSPITHLIVPKWRVSEMVRLAK